MAGGSQIIINKNGITFITPAKFEAKAGQHKFVGGKKIGSDFPFLAALIDFQSDLCPIRQVYSKPVAYAPPVTADSQLSKNIASTTVTATTVKCSSHIPKKEDKNYKLGFPVVNNYRVNKQGVKTSSNLTQWTAFPSRKFDLLYDPSLNKITAKLIISVEFVDAVKLINGIQESVNYDNQEIQMRLQKVIPRPYDNNKLLEIKKKIEETLNKETKYLTPVTCNQVGGCTCKIPMSLEVEFVEKGRSHHKVKLFPKSERANMENWAEIRIYQNTPMSPDIEHTLAHEVGHLFAFPDEYYFDNGMVHKMYIDPQTKIVDLTIPEKTDDWKRYSLDNLMGGGSSRKNPQMPKYYFNFIKDWFEKETGIKWNIVL